MRRSLFRRVIFGLAVMLLPGLVTVGSGGLIDVDGDADEKPLSFVNDVLPVLSKAGCNGSHCHSKPEGQNGFKLSVFAYDPESDYNEITGDNRGRRIMPGAPEQSLLLLKATGAVPHEGGERFASNSPAHAMLLRWISSGAPFRVEGEPELESIYVSPAEIVVEPESHQQLTVTARYSDETEKDVTALTRFESRADEFATVDENGAVNVGQRSGDAIVIAQFMGKVAISRLTVPTRHDLPEDAFAKLPATHFIDRLAYERFQRLGLMPSDLSSDGDFLRRASLDLIGALPTVEQAREFLADSDPDKRTKAIDTLLEHPRWADHWAVKWADLLRPNPDRAGVKSVYLLDQWIREQFRNNVPFDEFAKAVLTAEGSTHRFGPAVVFRDRREPADRTTLFSQVFLGVRMECAKCHHHPNEKWSQDDFYQMAAFFGEVKRKGTGISPPISGSAEFFYHSAGGKVKHPVTEAVMKPKPPDGPFAKIPEGDDPRQALADWVTQPDNPFFAKAIVNRVWGEMMGRGFVHPVDDFRASNPANHEAVLNALATDFASHGYDLKHLMRTIATSRLYQLSSTPNATNIADTGNFSRSYKRRLPAEVAADAVAQVTGTPARFAGLPGATSAVEVWNFKTPSDMLDAFGRPDSSSDCPCERNMSTSVVQALHLMHSDKLQEQFSAKGSRLTRLLSDTSLQNNEIIDELYLAAYCRYPDPDEQKLASDWLAEAGTGADDPANARRGAVEDLLWALLNTAEFVFNH
ncbi:MAG: DUF1553 domain-containing protein [Verrucomicrobiae bacterium]|nr:DUF1553 domain-containing protein [Verrucomicrobiae bacterium]